MEIIDHDDNPDELIDRFAINVTTPFNATTGRKIYSGIFGYAEIDMTVTILCTENFYGPDCDLFCPENCICESGFTGQLCETSTLPTDAVSLPTTNNDTVSVPTIQSTMMLSTELMYSIVAIVITVVFVVVVVVIILGVAYFRKSHRLKSSDQVGYSNERSAVFINSNSDPSSPADNVR